MTGNRQVYYQRKNARNKIETIMKRRLTNIPEKDLLLIIQRNKQNEYIAKMKKEIAKELSPRIAFIRETRTITFD